MERKEALAIVKGRNKARRTMEECQKALWSGGEGSREQRYDRLKAAEKEFKEVSVNFASALAVIL